MSERRPVEILTKDHLIRGFDLEVTNNRVRLIRDNPSKGIMVIDITDVMGNDLDFAVLIPVQSRR